MDYPEVKNAHVVPRCYLRNFAVEDAVMLNVDGRAIDRPVSIDSAAIRKHFYRRYRQDGTPIDDVEWSLAQLEGAVAPLLRDLKEKWPLGRETEKAPLAEFLAFQFVRGPRWKAWYEEQGRKRVKELRRNPEPVLHNGIWLPMTQKHINEFEDRVLSENEWLTRMMMISNKLITIFGSMRWQLIEFDEPLLAISDHPVTAWGLEGEHRPPEPTPAGLGALNLLEVRAPISPTLALLMSWQDLPDMPDPLTGSREIAANINAFTIANAERQWLHMPGGEVLIAQGLLDPIGVELLDGYGPEQAKASGVRHGVTEMIQPKLGQELRDAVDDQGRMNAQIVTAGQPS